MRQILTDQAVQASIAAGVVVAGQSVFYEAHVWLWLPWAVLSVVAVVETARGPADHAGDGELSPR